MNNKGLVGGVIVLIIAAVFVFGIIIGFGFSNKTQTPKVIYENIDQPMLLAQMDEWGENELDSSERILDYWVYNFGNTEAKNVKVICKIINFDEVILKEEEFNIGNIASSSYKFQESIMKYSKTLPIDNYAICIIKSADGEYINLYKRLDDVE